MAKNYTEKVISAPTINAVTLPGNVNTAPFLTTGTQFNGIANTTAVLGGTLDFFSPFTSIFNDLQTSPDLLTYTATLADGSPLSGVGLQFGTVPGDSRTSGRRGSLACWGVLDDTGLHFRYGRPDRGAGKGNRSGGLSVTSTFVINVLPSAASGAPVASNDSYVTLENTALQTLPSQSVLHNDIDPGQNPMTAAVVTGPAHGTLKFNPDGTFIYTPTAGYSGADSFTYQDTDSALQVSNIATASFNILPIGTVNIAPTAPATVTSLTTSFVFGGPATAPTFTWDSSVDGVTWTLGVATTATYQPAVTGAAGIFLRSNATYTDLTSNITKTVTSAPVHYVLGTAGADAILGIAGNNIIFGAAGDDVITAGAGPMLAYGGDGNDTFKATVGDGSATYDGQAGTNTYDLSATSAGATVNLLTGTATSAQTGTDTLVAIQNVVGGSGADTITGLATGGVFTGGAGNDTITGGAGNDRFVAVGGDGNDTYVGGGGSDTYDLSQTSVAAVVNLLTGTSTSTALGSGTDKLTAINNVIGSSAADTITGNNAGDTFTGSGGNDTITGGTGNDTFIATIGDGNDTYNGGAGINTLDLSATKLGVAVSLNGGAGSATGLGGNTTEIGTDVLVRAFAAGGINFNSIENVTGGSGNDSLVGDGSNNVLKGGAGNDTMNGMTGADTMIGGLGNDTYIVDNVGDVVTEDENAPVLVAGVLTPEVDTVNVSLNAYTLGANVENMNFITAGVAGSTFTGTGNTLDNVIKGDATNKFINTLSGGAGNDNLVGGQLADTLIGGTGNDVLTGGAGNDTFRYLLSDGAFGNDRIADFTVHNGTTRNDQIDLTGFGITAFGGTGATSVSATGIANAVVTVKVGGVIEGTMTLTGVNSSALSALDFKFA